MAWSLFVQVFVFGCNGACLKRSIILRSCRSGKKKETKSLVSLLFFTQDYANLLI